MFVDVSAKTQAEPRRPARVDPAARRGRGAQGQPGHRGVRRGHRVQARPGPRRRRDRARPARHAARSATRSSPAPTGAACARCTTTRATRSRRPRPSEPVEVLGFDTVPEAGEFVRVVENDRTARQLAGERATRLKTEALARRGGKKVSLETIFDQRARRRWSRSSTSCSRPTCPARSRRSRTRSPSCRRTRSRCRSCCSGVGGITESDVNLAAASDAVVLGFNVRPVGEARQLADREGVEIRTYSVIYRAIDELRDAMQGMLAPEEVEETVGTARGPRRSSAPREIGTIAGCYVTDGQGHARRASAGWCATARSSTTARSPRCGASTTTCARSQTGFECGIVLRELRGRQGRRRDRGLRDAAGRAHALLACRRARVRRPPAASICFFPDAGSLKAKRAELNRVKAHLRERHGRVRGRGRPPGHVAALDARRGARGRLAGALRGGRRRVAALRSTRASRRACASSGGSPRGATWRH